MSSLKILLAQQTLVTALVSRIASRRLKEIRFITTSGVHAVGNTFSEAADIIMRLVFDSGYESYQVRFVMSDFNQVCDLVDGVIHELQSICGQFRAEPFGCCTICGNRCGEVRELTMFNGACSECFYTYSVKQVITAFELQLDRIEINRSRIVTSINGLRRQLYQAYQMTCSYCNDDCFDLDDMDVDHIIPRSVPINRFLTELRGPLPNHETRDDFLNRLKEFLPADHDAVCNLTLSCTRCNCSKNDSRLPIRKLMHHVGLAHKVAALNLF